MTVGSNAHAGIELPGLPEIEFQEGAFMFHGAKKQSRQSKRRRREQGEHSMHWGSPFDVAEDAADESEQDETVDSLESLDASLLSEEERVYRAAKKRADQKLSLMRAGVRAALITVPMLIFIPVAGFFTFLYFGVDLGRRAFKLFYEPELRERFLQDEVKRRVHTTVRSERQNLEGEHHRSLEQLSASIAHEIRNPITAAKSLIQQMGEDPLCEDREEYARVAVAELERVERSISHLLRFGREEEARIESVSLRDVLESAIETFRDRCTRDEIEVQRDYDGAGVMEGDAEQLRRVAINLISNAMDAISEASIDRPRVRITMGENLAGSEVWMRVADNGLGMEAETRERIFDPFFTSREAGTGLGLALCRKIVDEHGGTIEVDSQAGEGSEFVLTFPKQLRGNRSR